MLTVDGSVGYANS